MGDIGKFKTIASDTETKVIHSLTGDGHWVFKDNDVEEGYM